MGSTPLPLTVFKGPIVDPKTGLPTVEFIKYMTNFLAIPVSKIATPAGQSTPANPQPAGQIKSTAVVQNRTEGIGTTVGNINNTGQLQAAGVGFNGDNVPDGANYLRTPTMVGSTVLVENGNFEDSATLPPPGWSPFGNGTVLSYEIATPWAGLRSLKVTTGTTDGGVDGLRRILVRPGDTYRISAQLKLIGGASLYAAVVFRDKNGAGLLSAQVSSSAGAWTFKTGSAIAPANSVYATLQLGVIGGGGNVGEFDEIHVARMQTSFEVTPNNTAGTPTTTAGLCTQHGAGLTQIDIASSIWQFGDGQVSYNSGSVDPGSLGTWYIYADDPGFNGGAVAYIATSTPSVANAANGRLFFGKITTAAGTATSTGGGSGGGGPSGKAALL